MKLTRKARAHEARKAAALALIDRVVHEMGGEALERDIAAIVAEMAAQRDAGGARPVASVK